MPIALTMAFGDAPAYAQALIREKIPDARADGDIAVLQDDTGQRCYYTPGEWSAFILGVKDGEFDDMGDVGPDKLVAMRDSKDPDGVKLFFTPAVFRDFLEEAKKGGYDFGMVKEE
jgi:hypothetical protein